ncbi:MAG: sugar transferase [Lentisphaeraceae bacterium]|nr:sugar transferase [Lentisphaeraceae bacterium]
MIKLLQFFSIIKQVFLASVLSFAFFLLMCVLSSVPVERNFLLELFTYFLVILLISHFIYSVILHKVRLKGYFFSRVLIAGSGLEAQRVKSYLDSEHGFGQKFLGFICINRKQEEEIDWQDLFGAYNELKIAIADKKIDELYWTLPNEFDRQYKEVINMCEQHKVHLHIVPDDLVSPLRNLEINTFDGLPVMCFRQEPLGTLLGATLKRAFDVLISLFLIVFVLSWLIPLIAMMIKLTSKGPVFVLVDFLGEKQRSFTVVNFRILTINEEKKKTRVGKLLCKFHLQKIPEIFSCLGGTMSIVGPRAKPYENMDEHRMAVNNFMVRHFIKPGLVSWTWVCGVREDGESREDLQAKVECDVWYIENWSLWLDVKICFYTVTKVFRDGKSPVKPSKELIFKDKAS